jgi:hypothetical protein
MSLSVPLHPVLDVQRQYAMVAVTITSELISTESYYISLSMHYIEVKIYPDKNQDVGKLIRQCYRKGVKGEN